VPSLRIVCTLTLPEFHPDYCLQTVRHSERRQDLHAFPVPPTFHSVLEDMVISTTFLLHLALRSLRPRKSSQRSAIARSFISVRQRLMTAQRMGRRKRHVLGPFFFNLVLMCLRSLSESWIPFFLLRS
jgi:hypothetical protein